MIHAHIRCQSVSIENERRNQTVVTYDPLSGYFIKSAARADLNSLKPMHPPPQTISQNEF
jgi:hypothetical protein